jgi:putative flippase GtrA
MISYAAFALIATAANIGTQDLVSHISGDHLVWSVMAGTFVGLLIKYVLDKRYIFRFRVRNAAHDGRVFFLYAMMGLLTTAVFWGFEFAFHYLFASKAMRYLGGVIGLAIGYFAKYHLDKHYVFRTERA